MRKNMSVFVCIVVGEGGGGGMGTQWPRKKKKDTFPGSEYDSDVVILCVYMCVHAGVCPCMLVHFWSACQSVYLLFQMT